MDTTAPVVFTAGNVLSRAFSVYGSNLASFTAITALVHIPLFAVGYLLAAEVGSESPDLSRVETLGLAFTGLAVLLHPIASAAVIYGVFHSLRGQRADFGDCLSQGLARALPVLGVAILAGFTIMGGMLLFIIPGLIAAVALYLAIPAAVVERIGPMAALTRSWALTDGSRWGIFGLVFVIGLMTNGSSRIFETLWGEDAGTFGLYLAATLVVSVFAGTLGSVAESVAYHDLRVLKEDLDADDLLSVFD